MCAGGELLLEPESTTWFLLGAANIYIYIYIYVYMYMCKISVCIYIYI